MNVTCMGLAVAAAAAAIAAVATATVGPPLAAAAAEVAAAARPAGSGIRCEVVGTAGCDGAFKYLTTASASLPAKKYAPERNVALEATLLAAAAAADGRGRPFPQARAEAEALADAAAAVVAEPARLDAVAATTWRSVVVTVPKGAAPSPSAPRSGTFEMAVTYLCLRVDVYANVTDAAFARPPVGPFRWVDVAVLVRGGVQLLLPFDTAAAAVTPGCGGGGSCGDGPSGATPVGCGTSALNLSALSLAADSSGVGGGGGPCRTPRPARAAIRRRWLMRLPSVLTAAPTSGGRPASWG